MVEHNAEELSIKTKRLVVILAGILIVGVCVALIAVVAPVLLEFVSDPKHFRAWVDSHWLIGRLTMIGLMIMKVVFPILPGKPFEIGAGYAFGTFEGLVLCLLGATIGSLIVFLLVRGIGVKVLDLFYPREKLLSLKFLQDEKRLEVWVFFIMMIPGTPKDFFSYFVGLTNMKLSHWMIISPIARIPSMLIAVVGGNALGAQNYMFAVGVFAITALISLAGITGYTVISNKKNKAH